jgi:hypothetical protein
MCEGRHQAHYLSTTVCVGANACCKRGAESEVQRVGCMREYEYSVQNSSLIESDRSTRGSSVPCICTLRPSASWMGSMQRPPLHETSKVKKVGECCFDVLKTVQPPPSELLSEVGLVAREGERGRKDGASG